MGRPRKPYFRKSDQCWVSRFNGQYVKLAKGRKNKTAALQRFHELHLEEEKNPGAESAEHTVASIIDLYLTFAKKRYSERTLYERTHYLQAFAEAHGWREIPDCRPLHLTNWLDANPQWKSDWTLASIINIVQRPFNWAVRQGLLVANPFRGVTHRPGQPRRPMTPEEFRALLRAAAGRKSRKKPSPAARFRQVLVFLRFTGCRPGELCRLEWTDINLDDAVIVLEVHKTSRTQREPRPRVIPLDPVIVKLLIHIRRRQEPGSRVFLTPRKSSWNRSNLSLRLRRAREKAGIPDDVKLYGLRHAFGTRSVLNGVDLKTLAALMGHVSTRMTEHYVHLAGHREHLAAAMRRANGHHPGS